MIGAYEFIDYLEKGEIPPEPPIGTSLHGWGGDFSIDTYDLKERANNVMMFALVTKVWTQKLAFWIDGRKCLEVMAGVGWLSKALSNFGVDITATDDHSWGYFKANSGKLLFPVEKLDAVEAVKQYDDAQVLIVSWPPYKEDTIVKACQEWGCKRPIVYIGEWKGGCTASDEFFKHFRVDEDAPEIPLPTWRGIHDEIFIGHWYEDQKDE